MLYLALAYIQISSYPCEKKIFTVNLMLQTLHMHTLKECWTFSLELMTAVLQRITVVPNNLFGKHDNYDLENSHVTLL